MESDPSTGPVHQTDILMDEAVSACVCCLSSSQITLSVDHTHTQHELTQIQTHSDTCRKVRIAEETECEWLKKKKERNDKMKREETVKRDEGNTFFFFFTF